MLFREPRSHSITCGRTMGLMAMTLNADVEQLTAEEQFSFSNQRNKDFSYLLFLITFGCLFLCCTKVSLCKKTFSFSSKIPSRGTLESFGWSRARLLTSLSAPRRYACHSVNLWKINNPEYINYLFQRHPFVEEIHSRRGLHFHSLIRCVVRAKSQLHP